jgi:hypothetical protein
VEEAARVEVARLRAEADETARVEAEAEALVEALRTVSDSDIDEAVRLPG